MVKRTFSLKKIEEWKEANQHRFQLTIIGGKMLLAPKGEGESLIELNGPRPVGKYMQLYKKQFFFHFELEKMSNFFFIFWSGVVSACLVAELGIIDGVQLPPSSFRLGLLLAMVLVSYFRRKEHQKQLTNFELAYCYLFMETENFIRKENGEPPINWSQATTIEIKENQPSVIKLKGKEYYDAKN